MRTYSFETPAVLQFETVGKRKGYPIPGLSSTETNANYKDEEESILLMSFIVYLWHGVKNDHEEYMGDLLALGSDSNYTK